MSEVISVAPSSLLLDAENPRLLEPNSGQREAMRALAQAMPQKIVNLAKDIAEQGLNPSELPIVMPIGPKDDRYIALEGNRRVVALKALENPDTFAGAIDAANLTKLRQYSRLYLKSPIDLVQCLRVANRDEAQHWINLRHTGENAGAGIVQWGADETSRFKARSGKKKSLSLQALELLEEAGALKPGKRSDVPTSSLTRLLNTPEVRAKLGLDLREGELVSIGPESKVIKALKFVVEDLASGNTKVGAIYSKEQRAAYAENFPTNLTVKGKPAAGAQEKQKGSLQKAKASSKTPRLRQYLIPKDCVLAISQRRVQAIEGELRTLNIEEHTNAVAVLFRVFLELSVDVYLEANAIGVTVNDKLAKKMQEVLNDLTAKKKITQQQAKPVKAAFHSGSYLRPSIPLMHDYVHNTDVFPAPSDLRAHWDSIQAFVTAMWSP